MNYKWQSMSDLLQTREQITAFLQQDAEKLRDEAKRAHDIQRQAMSKPKGIEKQIQMQKHLNKKLKEVKFPGRLSIIKNYILKNNLACEQQEQEK